MNNKVNLNLKINLSDIPDEIANHLDKMVLALKAASTAIECCSKQLRNGINPIQIVSDLDFLVGQPLNLQLENLGEYCLILSELQLQLAKAQVDKYSSTDNKLPLMGQKDDSVGSDL